MRPAAEDHDNPVTTRRQRLTTTRGARIRGEGELIAHVDRAVAQHRDDVKIDLTAILVGADDQVPFGDRSYCVFYNAHLSPDHSTRFVENLVDGTEFLRVTLPRVDEKVSKIVFVVSVYDAEVLGHTLGSAEQPRFWIEGDFASRTDARAFGEDLSALFPGERAVVVGEVYRSGHDWDYRPLGGGHTYPSLADACRAYGVVFDG
jgi:stress response protein SCP2